MKVYYYADHYATNSGYTKYNLDKTGFDKDQYITVKCDKGKSKERGFTLMELMIVIAIIGILFAVAIPKFIGYRDKAFCSATEKDANNISAALADYFAIPSHTDLQTPITLAPPEYDSGGLKIAPLSNKNIATITSASISEICISVIDVSSRCPDEYGRAGSPYWHKVGGLWVFETCPE